MKSYYEEQKQKAIIKTELLEEGFRVKSTELGAYLSENARHIAVEETGKAIDTLDKYLKYLAAVYDARAEIKYYDEKLKELEEGKKGRSDLKIAEDTRKTGKRSATSSSPERSTAVSSAASRTIRSEKTVQRSC